MRAFLIVAVLGAAALLAAGALLLVFDGGEDNGGVVPPPLPLKPGPCPDDKCPDDKCPKPKKPRWETHGVVRAFCAAAPAARSRGSLGASAFVGGPRNPDGTEVACDLPGKMHRKNTSSKGLGLCVFTSIHHASEWQDVGPLIEFPKWMIERGVAGGGYPEKVAELIPRICKDRGQPVPDYFQIEDAPDKVLPLMRAASKTGRMMCVTYQRSPTGRYGGSTISHMVNAVHCDEKWVVILDNNYVGEDAYEWMTPEEFSKCGSFGGKIWLIVFAEPPPPMPPYNSGPRPDSRPAAAETDGESDGEKCYRGCKCGCADGAPCRCLVRRDAGAYTSPGVVRFRWSAWNGNSSWLSLYDGNIELGVYDTKRRTYHPAKGDGTYGLPTDPPIAPPGDFGLDLRRWEHKTQYLRGGTEVSYDEVLSALEKVPDDAGKRRVTVIGSKEDRARIEADWKNSAPLAAVKDAFVFRAYDPSHWHVKDYGFVTDPLCIRVNEPDGKELFYAASYEGPEQLAVALRRLRPDYRPDRSGGTRVLPWLRSLPGATSSLGYLCAAAAFGGLLIAVFLLLAWRARP